jgi:ribonuclease-3
MRASIVCEASLARGGQEYQPRQIPVARRGEDMGGGRERPSVLSDAYEALIAAIYLDGDWENVGPFLRGGLMKDIATWISAPR